MNISELAQKISFAESDFGAVGILPVAVLRAFKDAANQHANLLGLGYNNIKDKGYSWAVMRIKYEVLRQPNQNEELIIVTYPSAQNMFEFDRDFVIYDKDKTTTIKGTSKWCLFDLKQRRIVRLDKIEKMNIVFGDPVFEGRFLKTESFEPTLLPDFSYKIASDDIDENNHTNSTVYAKIIGELLKNHTKKIKVFQVNFLKESFVGNRLDLYMHSNDNELKIVGRICEGENSFSSLIKF